MAPGFIPHNPRHNHTGEETFHPNQNSTSYPIGHQGENPMEPGFEGNSTHFGKPGENPMEPGFNGSNATALIADMPVQSD